MANALYFLVLTVTIAVVAGAQGPQRPKQRDSQNVDFCSVKTCSPRAHTLCKFRPRQVSPACGNVDSKGLTDAEINEVLGKHNELRAKVARGQERRGNPGPQPAARNLGPLKWNKKLARIAQIWANQCIYEHDECRNTESKMVGQNIAYSSWSGPYNAILSDMVNGWYDEVKDFNSREVKSYTGQSHFTQHYSQMVWAKATEIGCGLIRFNHRVTSKGYNRTQLVCNYAIRGNMIGESVYETR